MDAEVDVKPDLQALASRSAPDGKRSPPEYPGIAELNRNDINRNVLLMQLIRARARSHQLKNRGMVATRARPCKRDHKCNSQKGGFKFRQHNWPHGQGAPPSMLPHSSPESFNRVL